MFMVIIAIYILASYFIEKYRVPFLHESTIAIVLGLFTAVVLQFVYMLSYEGFREKDSFF